MRRRAPLNLLTAAAAALATVVVAPLAGPAAPAQAVADHAAVAHAAHKDAPTGQPSVEVFASGGGIVADGADVVVSVVVANPSTDMVTAGHVTVSVTTGALRTPAALADFRTHPTAATRRNLGSATTASVAAGGTTVVARVTVPAASLALPSSKPGVFGLAASVTTSSGTLGTGAGTLVVPGASPKRVGVAAVMPLTVPTSSSGLISATDLATYTAPDGVLSRELEIAQSNPSLTIGIDPKILVSIRVLGQSAPATAKTWLADLADLADLTGNPTFPLQYGDADPVLQLQAGLAKPLQPSDFTYAMSPGDFSSAPLTVGEPTETPTATPTPTPSPTGEPHLPPLSELTGFRYSLDSIAWPAAGTVRATDVKRLAGAGLTDTIVSSTNTNAATVAATPDAALDTAGGSVLVTDDALSSALQTAASATDATESSVATDALNAQLALASENAAPGTVVLASLSRAWPTDASRAATAVGSVLDSAFSHPATIESARASTPTPGLTFVDHANPSTRLQPAGELLDLAGEPRSGGTVPEANITSFSNVLTNPLLLTGDVRARLLTLFSVGWSGSPDWSAAVTKQYSSMQSTLSAVQIVSPGSIRQASRQALIPITVENKLAHPVDVVLRATPTSTRLEVESDTTKTIAAGSSAKVLVPVKAQLSNGTVFLSLQLYSESGIEIGDLQTAQIDVHADWEGVGALVFGIIVAGFFGFGLFRTIQRRRREKAQAHG
ncbi:hypothetical protein GCM10022286_21270 [Gryllotalpicola daejeonensis]|uniref:2-oxoglutarate dehydrogenase n=1 Tax=Gryllotalpicola daejeonensis TaxID=993087 RepID=A0ABP7ZL21_9MICO